MINLNKRRIDFGKGDVGIGVVGNTSDSAQLAFYNQSARPIQCQYISFIVLNHTHIHKTDLLNPALFFFIQRFSDTFVDIRSFGFIMLEDLSIRNPDFCIFNFFINRIHHFFQMFVTRKSTFFHIIISGCLKHPFRNLFFLLHF